MSKIFGELTDYSIDDEESYENEVAYAEKLYGAGKDIMFLIQTGVTLLFCNQLFTEDRRHAKKIYIEKIKAFIRESLDGQNGACSYFIALFSLPKKTSEDEIVMRLTYITLQLIDQAGIFDGVDIDFSDVISGPLTIINVKIKPSKLHPSFGSSAPLSSDDESLQDIDADELLKSFAVCRNRKVKKAALAVKDDPVLIHAFALASYALQCIYDIYLWEDRNNHDECDDYDNEDVSPGDNESDSDENLPF